MNMIDNQIRLEEIKQKLVESALHAQEQIENLGKTKDAEKLFIAIAVNISIGPVDEMDDITYGTVPAKLELLAFCLYPFFGLSQDGNITPWDTNVCIDALDTIFNANSFPQIDISKKENNPRNEVADQVLRQSRIVRGSAFPEQISNQIESIQGKYEDWFQKKLGIGPKKATGLIWAIFNNQQASLKNFMPKVYENGKKWQALWNNANNDRLNENSKELLSFLKDSSHAFLFGFNEKLNELSPIDFPVCRTDLLPLPSVEEWDALINLLGMTAIKRNQMAELINARQTPLFVFHDKRVLLFDRPNAFDVLWQKFEEEVKNDFVFYQKYQKTRSKWLENAIFLNITKIFPSESVFRNLSYSNLEKKNISTAEIDLVIKWGPFLVLIEAKSTQFRLEGQLGDATKLATDLKQNIEEAHVQAKRALNYIEITDNPIFKEIHGNRVLKINK